MAEHYSTPRPGAQSILLSEHVRLEYCGDGDEDKKEKLESQLIVLESASRNHPNQFLWKLKVVHCDGTCNSFVALQALGADKEQWDRNGDKLPCVAVHCAGVSQSSPALANPIDLCVRDIKQAIKTVVGIPVGDQQLFLCGSEEPLIDSLHILENIFKSTKESSPTLQKPNSTVTPEATVYLICHEGQQQYAFTHTSRHSEYDEDQFVVKFRSSATAICTHAPCEGHSIVFQVEKQRAGFVSVGVCEWDYYQQCVEQVGSPTCCVQLDKQLRTQSKLDRAPTQKGAWTVNSGGFVAHSTAGYRYEPRNPRWETGDMIRLQLTEDQSQLDWWHNDKPQAPIVTGIKAKIGRKPLCYCVGGFDGDKMRVCPSDPRQQTEANTETEIDIDIEATKTSASASAICMKRKKPC
jgi:hypothetical protein